jgi:hypothetical protein
MIPSALILSPTPVVSRLSVEQILVVHLLRSNLYKSQAGVLLGCTGVNTKPDVKELIPYI